MATWPATLPPPLRSGYAVEPEDQTLRTQMEFGASRVRRLSTADLDEVPVTWRFNEAEMTAFRAWFRDGATGAAGGTAWFTIKLKRGNSPLETVSARFKEPWKARFEAGKRWLVSAKLEVR